MNAPKMIEQPDPVDGEVMMTFEPQSECAPEDSMQKETYTETLLIDLDEN